MRAVRIRDVIAAAVFTFAAVQGVRAQEAAPAETPAAEAETPPVDPVVERGQYLAYAGNCFSCHTRPGGEPFSGGLPFQTPLGTIYSSNITPDPDNGIGKWTDADLIRAMHEGVAAG